MGGGFAYITFRRYTFVFVSGWYSLCIIICVIILSVISFTEIVDYCFVWNQFFIGFSGCLYYMKEESFQLTLAHSQVKVCPQKMFGNRIAFIIIKV